jgi:hypothetical protein
MRWVEDALDSILFGALPTWPAKWHTATGQSIGTMARRLYEQRTTAMLATTTHQGEMAHMRDEVDGLRATNEILTAQVETLERHQKGYLEALGVERKINSHLTVQLQGLGVAPKPYG